MQAIIPKQYIMYIHVGFVCTVVWFYKPIIILHKILHNTLMRMVV
jgi:hypothetical protein